MSVNGLSEVAGGADRFAVVDTETTGVYANDRVIEIAVVTIDLNGRIIDRYETLINPARDVGPTFIHGVTASMLDDAPFFDDVAGDIAMRLHGACVVAHNAPFDVRMITGEFVRLGGELIVPRAIDTYIGSGAKLAIACATHQIDLSGAHRASVDARATAELFLRLHGVCGVGAPTTAPGGLRAAGKVRRRDDAAPVLITPAPVVAQLAAHVPLDGLTVASQEYLEMVGRAVADLHLDRGERAELAALSLSLGLTAAQVAQAHRRYVNELVDAAIDDDVVTDDEYETVIRVAAALGVDQRDVEQRIVRYRTAATTVRLEPGTKVVFTGDHPSATREELVALAIERGLQPVGGVSKAVGLVCAADPTSRSGKASKARTYGIPIISIDEFVTGDLTSLTAAATAVSLNVVMCPDCHTTWTVPATTQSRSARQCSACRGVAVGGPAARAGEQGGAASTVARSPDPNPADTRPGNAFASAWAPPTVEWLTCRQCTTVWSRQVTRGRKPHLCPACTNTASLPPPSVMPGVRHPA